MNGLKQDMARIQELIGTAFAQTGCLVALSDGGMMSPEKLQQTLEHPEVDGQHLGHEDGVLLLHLLGKEETAGVVIY